MDSNASIPGNVSVVNNSASIAGGILISSGDVTMRNVFCTGNTAEEGPGWTYRTEKHDGHDWNSTVHRQLC